MIIPAFVSGVMFTSAIVRYLLQQYEYAIVDIIAAVVFMIFALKIKKIYGVEKQIEAMENILKKVEERKAHETGKQ